MKKILFVDYQEIGALLFAYAKAINEYESELKAYYVSFGEMERAHDSNKFHFGSTKLAWNLTVDFKQDSSSSEIDYLSNKLEYLRKIVSDLDPDIILTSGKGGYLCYKAGLNYFYWAYGSDLEQVAFNINGVDDLYQKIRFVYHYVNTNIELGQEDEFFVSLSENYWTEGIRNASALAIPSRSIKYLKKIRGDYKLVHIPHLVSHKDVSHEKELRCTKWHKDMTKVFFSSARHCWGNDRRYITDNKGNNIFIQAIALYKEKTGDSNFEIHLVEKGSDVGRTRKLLDELDFAEQTKWFNEMKRDELFSHYQSATLCFGQFGTPCLEFSAIEPMSTGIPTISWYGSNDCALLNEVPFYRTNPPIFNSRNALDISDYMIEILSDQLKYNDVSKKSFNWTRENCSINQIVQSLLKLYDCINTEDRKEINAIVTGDNDRFSLRDDIKRWFSHSWHLLQEYQSIHEESHQFKHRYDELERQYLQLQEKYERIYREDANIFFQKYRNHPVLRKILRIFSRGNML